MYKVSKVSMQDVYKENPELKEKEVEEILRWAESQPHLPKITDYEAAIFHHSHFYKSEETKKAIEIYYTYRTRNPNIFRNRDVLAEDIQQTIDCQLHIPLSKPLADGSRGYFISLVDTDAKKFNCNATIKTSTMILDWWHMTEGLSSGHWVIVNMKGMSIGYIFRISLMSLKAFVPFAQEYIPLRLKQVHFLNANRITQRFLGIIKPFLKKEIYEMIHVHTTMESAYKFIPRENLPAELGGTEKTLAELQVDMRKILTENRQFFLDEDTERSVDESLRK